ncbi:cytochrome P450 [Atractiella rhizophila]|nr:cytochrome P450 [Atractiella rhizophila]
MRLSIFFALLEACKVTIFNLVALSISIFFYRNTSLHPLSQYPGPILAKSSKLYELYWQSKGLWYLKVQDMHKRYGDIVRTGPNDLSFATPETMSSILHSRLPKSQAASSTVAVDSLHTIRNPDQHAILRKQWNPGFGPSALKNYEPMITQRTDQLVSKLVSASHDSSRDLHSFFCDFILFLTSDLAGFSDFDDTSEEDLQGFFKFLENSLFFVACFQPLPHFRSLFERVFPVKDQERLLGTSLKLLQKRFERKLHKDIIYYVLGQDPGEVLKPENLSTTVGNAFLVLGAGTDTTLSTMTFLFYYLLREPHYYQKLQSDVDIVYGSAGDFQTLNADQLGTCLYLEACINEALRLQPPLRLGSSRSIPAGGWMVNGHFVSAGTVVSSPVWTLHRDVRIWGQDADLFRPERWLEPKVPKHAWFPFSEGRANCIGKALAMMEMKKVVSVLVRNFDMKLDDRSRSFDDVVIEHVISNPGSLFVKIEKRSIT